MYRTFAWAFWVWNMVPRPVITIVVKSLGRSGAQEPGADTVLTGPATVQHLPTLAQRVRAARHSEAHPRHQSNAEVGGGEGCRRAPRARREGVGHKYIYILVVGTRKETLSANYAHQATAYPPNQ